METDNFFIEKLILLPVILGICLSVLLYVARNKSIEKDDLDLKKYVIGLFICVAINTFVFIATMGFLLLPCLIFTIGPLAYCGYTINVKIIKDTKLHNPSLNFVYKSIATLLIWIIALYPISLMGINTVMSIPAEITHNITISQLKKEIKNSETYVDLSKFGLGIYKQQNKGDAYIWDITKPEKFVITYDDIEMVYEHLINRKNESSWDVTWGISNKGKDVMYDIKYYEGTYIIISPLWDKPGSLYHFGSIYFCKEISKDADLYEMGILDPKVVDKFQNLPGEKLSRKELAEKLGKEF